MRTIRVLQKARFDKHGARPRSGRSIVALALALALMAFVGGITPSAENPRPMFGHASNPAQFTLHTDPLVYMFANQH